MEKLYKLSCWLGDKSEEARSLSYSHSIDKLCNTVPNDSWTVMNDPNDKTLVRESPDDQLPKYFIREVPFVI